MDLNLLINRNVLQVGIARSLVISGHLATDINDI